MANSRIYLKSEAGGTTALSRDTTANSGNLVLPASGNVASVDTAVTDNAIPRFDGTTGKLQNSVVFIDDNGNLGVGGSPMAKLSTLGANNDIAENVFMAGISGVTNGFIVSKDSVANPNYKFLTTNQATALEIDSWGMVLLKTGTGALGYGAGAGGTVTQLTSKSTTVSLNKPSGVITMNNAALGAGASATFVLNNAYISLYDVLLVSVIDDFSGAVYEAQAIHTYNGYCIIQVTNKTGASRSEAIRLSYSIIKGANS